MVFKNHGVKTMKPYASHWRATIMRGFIGENHLLSELSLRSQTIAIRLYWHLVVNQDSGQGIAQPFPICSDCALHELKK
jgi:hypothetical protein